MKQTINRINQVFLPLLFILYMSSVSLFYHAHVIDGVTIVHSHPFHSGEGQPTQTQIQLINYLNHVIVLDSVLHCIIPKIEIHRLYRILSILDIQKSLYSAPDSILLRGPPSISFY